MEGRLGAHAAGQAQGVLDAVRTWPATTVHIDDLGGTASIYVGGRIVAEVGLRTAIVSVFAPPDTLDSLLELFPVASRQTDGLRFRLAEGVPRDVALAAIRRRVRVERYAGQFREQSP